MHNPNVNNSTNITNHTVLALLALQRLLVKESFSSVWFLPNNPPLLVPCVLFYFRGIHKQYLIKQGFQLYRYSEQLQQRLIEHMECGPQHQPTLIKLRRALTGRCVLTLLWGMAPETWNTFYLHSYLYTNSRQECL